MTGTTVQVASVVPSELADALREKARRAERSIAAEIRLALKAWVVDDQPEDAAA
jgi:hypothetical protein